MQVREIQDVVAFVVPEKYGDGPIPQEQMDELAYRLVMGQYAGRTAIIEITKVDWLVTKDADEADAFQPAHDCAACVAGADQARSFLREHPDRRIALGNISYTEQLL